MDGIADNIEQLREVGISLGLDDKEIDIALNNSLIRENAEPTVKGAAPPKTTDVTKKVKKGRLRRCLKWMCICMFVLYFVLCFFCVASVYFPAEDAAQTSIAYQIARILRFIALPIVWSVDLSDYHEMTCILPNPFFSPPPIDCEPCRGVATISRVSNIDSDVFKNEYAVLSQPVVIKDDHTSISFSNLKEMYEKNREKFSKGGFKIGSNCDNITSLDSFMSEYSDEILVAQTGLHLHWSVSSVRPSQAFRSIFKRPYFIGKSAEIFVEKSIFVDSSTAPPYSLTGSRSPNLLYIQASGSRRMFLIPRGNCANKCQSLSTVLSAGNALFIPDRFWRLDSIASPNATEELSISFVTNFS